MDLLYLIPPIDYNIQEKSGKIFKKNQENIQENKEKYGGKGKETNKLLEKEKQEERTNQQK